MRNLNFWHTKLLSPISNSQEAHNIIYWLFIIFSQFNKYLMSAHCEAGPELSMKDKWWANVLGEAIGQASPKGKPVWETSLKWKGCLLHIKSKKIELDDLNGKCPLNLMGWYLHFSSLLDLLCHFKRWYLDHECNISSWLCSFSGISFHFKQNAA